jgi:hypothetical protein
MSEKKVYNGWPAEIPKVGQIVQVLFGDENVLEGRVCGRRTQDGKTFYIWLDWPWTDGKLILHITPSASEHGLADAVANVKPHWRVFSNCSLYKPQDAKLFVVE